MTDVIDLDTEKAKRLQEKSGGEKISQIDIFNELLLCFEQKNPRFRHDPFPHNIWYLNNKLQSLCLLVDNRGQCEIISRAWFYGELCRYSNSLIDPRLRLDMDKARKCAEYILSNTEKAIDELPPPLSFVGEEEFSFFKIDPVPTNVTSLRDAPIICGFANRMTNFEAFAMSIARICIPKLGLYRKQSLWIYGPSNSGKTTLLNAIGEYLGFNSRKMHGAFMSCNTEDFMGRFFLSQTINKRVLSIDEPHAKFIRSERFKSITGNKYHSVEMKGKDFFSATLDFGIIFTANDEPPLKNDEAFISRLILCKISELSEGERDESVQARLLLEIPYLVAYGAHLIELKALKPWAPIPHDDGELREIAAYDDFESGIIFDRFFELDPNVSLKTSTIEHILMIEAGIRNRHTRRKVIKDFERMFGLEKVRSRTLNNFCRSLKGLKPRFKKLGGHQNETMDIEYELDPAFW